MRAKRRRSPETNLQKKILAKVILVLRNMLGNCRLVSGRVKYSSEQNREKSNGETKKWDNTSQTFEDSCMYYWFADLSISESLKAGQLWHIRNPNRDVGRNTSEQNGKKVKRTSSRRDLSVSFLSMQYVLCHVDIITESPTFDPRSATTKKLQESPAFCP